MRKRGFEATRFALFTKSYAGYYFTQCMGASKDPDGLTKKLAKALLFREAFLLYFFSPKHSKREVNKILKEITDSQRRTFDRSIDGQTAKGMAQGKVDLFLQQVQPGLNVTGDIVFDIPKDATGLKLLVKGGYFGKGQQIDLGK